MSNPLQQRGMLVNRGLGTPAPAYAPTVLSPHAAGIAGAEAAQSVPYGHSPRPGVFTTQKFDAQRFSLAGGQLNSDILHPLTIPFEQLYRRLPEEGMFASTVSPSNPFAFELGAFTVPDRMALLIFDLRPDIYRFSGVDAGDYLPIENRRFASIMGFDLTVDQQRQGNTVFQLDPVPIQRTSQQAFNNNNTTHPEFNAGQYEIGRSNTFSNVAGVGTSLLPQRPTRFGALSIPFTIYAKSKQVVQVRCVIFKPIPTPIAFIEYDIAGILVPEIWANSMVEAVKPPVRDGAEGTR